MAGENSAAARERQRRRAIAGGLLVAGLAAIALLIFFLDDLIDAAQSDYTIHVVVTGAGVPEGAPVWVNGRPTGTVSAVGLLPSDRDAAARVILALRLPASARSQVRADSRVLLKPANMMSIMSARVVDVAAGTAGSPVLGAGDTLFATRQPTRADVARKARTVAGALDSAVADARTHMPALRRRFTEAQMALAALDGVVSDIGLLEAGFDSGAIAGLLRGGSFAASIHNVRDHITTIGSRLDTLGVRIRADGEFRLATERLLARADSLRNQLAFADSILNEPNTTYARLRADSALVRAIGTARAELDSLVADVRRNPMRYAF